MTDSDPTAQPVPMVLAVSPEAYMQLLERVELLEARVRAGADDRDLELALRGIDDRLDRHRGDIEALKSAQNATSRFLRAQPPTGPVDATTTPGGFL